jgi:hypothetical protein
VDQPTADAALRELEPLVGEWKVEMVPPGGELLDGNARTVFEWHDFPRASRPALDHRGARGAERWTARFEDGGRTIRGTWELAEDGEDFRPDFDLNYRKLD